MAQLSVVPSRAGRDEALALARTLPPPGPVPGRYWKIDLAKLALEELPSGSVSVRFELPEEAKRKGVVAADLASAAPEHTAVINATQGNAVDWRSGRFTALNAARRENGIFIFLPKGVVVEEPIVIRQRLEGPAAFPYVLVAASEGSRATILTRYEPASNLELVSEIVEIVALEHASVTYACVQDLPMNVRTFWSRRGNIGRDAELNWALAELGAELSVGDVRSTTLEAGAHTTIAGLFFPNKRQHVDLQSEADHPAGQTQSETIFKSAAIDGGQARFVGNIRIRPSAHGVDATLRDDALLLSKDAHIDSIPALEIGANDVKAYHGATIGAIDDEELFYAMSRGISRHEAERMIALGFFEPALVRFPTERLRDELRASLAGKIA
ncbi:MAG TPA: Fe-S cluster assembly protein SufD [Candidatus Acidoferrales bacterium]|nr:Fe-S cluster assembly protein SufD [Candidatus Acidoferrales bacterium]